MSMLARVLVLSLGIVCGLASGLVGAKWLLGGINNADAVAAKRSSDEPAVKAMVARFDGCRTASYFMLLAAPLGMAGGLLGGMGRGKLAIIPLLLAGILPLIFSGWTLPATFGFFLAAFLGLLIRRPQSDAERGLKGCWNSLKNWFNIGGVKVKFKDLDTNVSKSNSSLACTIELTAKGERHVNSVFVKFIRQETTKKKDDEGNSKSKTKEKVLGEATQTLDSVLMAGESRVLEFELDYEYEQGLKDLAGGWVGSAMNFATGTKEEYLMIVEADVDGALFEPSDKKKVKMVD